MLGIRPLPHSLSARALHHLLCSHPPQAFCCACCPWPPYLLLLSLLPQLSSYHLAFLLLPHIPRGARQGGAGTLLALQCYFLTCIPLALLGSPHLVKSIWNVPVCVSPLLPQWPCFQAAKGLPWACRPPCLHLFCPRGASSGPASPPSVFPPAQLLYGLLTLMGDSASPCLYPPLPSPFQAPFHCHLGFQSCPLTTSSAFLPPECPLIRPMY